MLDWRFHVCTYYIYRASSQYRCVIYPQNLLNTTTRFQQTSLHDPYIGVRSAIGCIYGMYMSWYATIQLVCPGTAAVVAASNVQTRTPVLARGHLTQEVAGVVPSVGSRALYQRHVITVDGHSRSNALSIQFEICSRLCYFLVVLRDALLLYTCHLSWALHPHLSNTGLGVACPYKVLKLRCDLSGSITAGWQ